MVGISLTLHALVIAYAGAPGRSHHIHVAPRERAVAKPAQSPSCDADVALATAARLLYCTTPLSDREACARAAVNNMSLGFVTCDAVAMSTEVALLTPEKVAAIEPEPLLDLLTPKEQQAFENAQAQIVEEKFAEVQKKLETPPEKGQVVEITRPNVETPPEHARFVAEFDSRADKETVARGSTEDMIERPQPRELAPSAEAQEPSSQKAPENPPGPDGNPEAPQGPGKLAMRIPGAAEPQTLDRQAETPGIADGSDAPIVENGLKMAKGNSAVHEEAKQASDRRPGQDGGGGGQVPNLRPTREMLERMVGGGSVDKLDNVADGESTALNAVRWKYATFFNRMKRRVAQNWHPDVVYARRDPTGNVYGSKDRVTYLQVALDPTGKVVQIHVMQSSGIDFLDEEAIRAFHEAQPFPNPPQGLVDPSSQRITFMFGFHFEVGRPSGWKVFRYQ